MLASQFGPTAFAEIMVDDTMEISSEHGHNIGDDDIDIDIDFTAGHVDEDYMLEDAASNAGFGDEFHAQPLPAMGHDDLMIDDGEESYAVAMDGADVMRDDDNHHMDDEPLEMSSSPESVPTVLVEEHHARDSSHPGAGDIDEEVSWEVNDEPELVRSGLNLEELQTPGSHQEDGETQKTTDIEEVETPAAGTTVEESRPNTLPEKSPKVDAVGEEPRSPPPSISPLENEIQDLKSSHQAEVPNGSSISQEVVYTIETTDAQEETSISSNPDVVVLYQDSEYTLFPKSETDDADSYFLSDLSIKDSPLSDFFEAIRNVIRGDLNDEDEICISAEGLGLEVEEMSSMTVGTTIGQIINLHEKLLQNDGVEPIRPLCLQLGTRPNFSIRFANLLSGASEGKGISELVHWDGQSESFEDSAHVTENENGEALEVESYEDDEGLEDVIEKEESTVVQPQISDDNVAQKSTTELEELPQEAGEIEKLDVSGDASTNGTHQNNDPVTQHTATEVVLPLQKNDAPSNGEDEDGDILDYSDEDEAQPELRKDSEASFNKLATDKMKPNGTLADFFSPCFKPHTCLCSKCNDLLLAEYEAINEELRRRSISRAAEDKLLQQAAKGADHDHESIFEVENDIEYDEKNEEDLDHGNTISEYENPLADLGEDHVAEFVNHEDEFYADDVEGEEVLDGYDLTTEPTNGGAEETFDEFDFGVDDNTQQHQEESISEGPETQFYDDDIVLPADPIAQSSKDLSIGNTVGFTDAPDSGSAASEKTLEAQPVSTDDLTTEFNEEHEDEIDYDDDEEPTLLQVPDPSVKELQATNNGSGKRQRTDSDDSSGGSKEAKRPRP